MADRKEINEHEEISFMLARENAGHVYRVLHCANCGGSELQIGLADNGQWSVDCLQCGESAEILSNLINTLR